MNVKTIVSILAVLVSVMTLFIVFQEYYNKSVSHETGIEAQYKSDENALAQLSLKAVEVMKVADAAREDSIAIITAAMKGKYGDSGSTAKMLWSSDGGLGGAVDPSIRKEVARIIAGGRTNFEQGQNVRIDKCRAYEVQRKQLISGIMTKMAGFPSDPSKLEKMCTPVTSSHAQKTFESGIDAGISL
jgi:hypothetical protein